MKKEHKLLLGLFGLSFFVAVACGENVSPTPDDDGGDISGGGAPATTGGSSSTGGAGPGGNAGTGGGFEVPEREFCSEEPNSTDGEGNECWDLSNCNGRDEAQFLRQCNSGTCFPFDNFARIEDFDGTLPN